MITSKFQACQKWRAVGRTRISSIRIGPDHINKQLSARADQLHTRLQQIERQSQKVGPRSYMGYTSSLQGGHTSALQYIIEYSAPVERGVT